MTPDSDQTLDGEDLETWAALARVLEWLPPAVDAPLQREAGLTHFEYGILFALTTAPEHTLRMSELASEANSTLTRLSRAVGRLEARGQVRRTPAPGDGRSTLAVLSEEGRDAFRRATPIHAANVRRLVLESLTQAQSRQLREISRRITAAIRHGGTPQV